MCVIILLLFVGRIRWIQFFCSFTFCLISELTSIRVQQLYVLMYPEAFWDLELCQFALKRSDMKKKQKTVNEYNIKLDDYNVK